MQSEFGKLYLIPTRLGDNPPLEVLPISVKKIVELVDDYIVENEKTARRFIKKIDSRKSQNSLNFKILNKYTQREEIEDFLDACKAGKHMGLLSEAGCPGIADPGADIVKLAHEHHIRVVPMVGPSSILLAMMASGMNGQSFTFNGYIPIDKAERKASLKRLERQSYEHNQSQIFIETPYRNNKILEDICGALHANTRVCVACDLTLPSEYIKTLTVKEWKHTNVDLHKRPAIFIIHKD
ncbi:SAM-dependent methyltransferase [Psychroserpens sp.]|uniref:SAM-dependent methyltransferase n=1 Tax=Psychroserpens sp. TaxID=2020870 RepID=UPI001B2CB131|nr:SAM-dependent methyltransferase [Psychroserpens sp.]MBO6606823.1 SAM-dependent methyltransferase [Psychroserpens sp.]MBO6631132.1 SAM-dependent methyltransferase [Psychroserpens sp.]MBO6653526.1 SAM-dependent methyltransferase [Psychroserpens sp.]MBO6680446.1 SAM-dependent methyltransferase [Psychroserpens sp.]MBO6750595.1 SAM-dependent methyltransferase [Psychroserpens sp.]